MSKKAIVHKVPENVRRQSIETLKIRKESLEYLRQNGYKTIDDIIERQNDIPTEIRGNIYAYIMFGKESAGIPEEILLKNQATAIRIPMV